ncbi:MAG: FeoA family protein [Actinomycetota bacterium]|nr:FeoA family protein [Actinomycetota bacterium]
MKGMPLSLATVGSVLDITEIRGGAGLQKRLADMGLMPGTRVRLVQKQERGPVLIELKGSRLALGRGMAHKIMVEEANSG